MAVEVPIVRRGRGSGYPGRAEIDAAGNRFRRALAFLAREPDPDARQAGAMLAEAAAAVLTDLAERAEAASPTLRRMERKLAAAQRLAADRAAQSPTPAATRATGTQQRRA